MNRLRIVAPLIRLRAPPSQQRSCPGGSARSCSFISALWMEVAFVLWRDTVAWTQRECVIICCFNGSVYLNYVKQKASQWNLATHAFCFMQDYFLPSNELDVNVMLFMVWPGLKKFVRCHKDAEAAFLASNNSITFTFSSGFMIYTRPSARKIFCTTNHHNGVKLLKSLWQSPSDLLSV